MPLLFAATLFVSASLLFMIQPMVGKMVLPLLGGSPAVWNACMVFFQALLLLGYLYSHYVSGKYTPRKQWMIHILVLGLPLVTFLLAVMFGIRHNPIAVAESLAPGGDTSPILSVLMLLTVAIGIPFFVISTSAPLLQKWFTCTGHPAARDPYFLYAASNLGSMISLLGYPLLIEPYLSISGQAWLFAIGFAVLAALIALCGHAEANPIGVPPAQTSTNKQAQRNVQKDEANQSVTAAGTEPPPTLARKAKWIALAFVPSSLMLGVTFHMTTDIASVPLLWVGPLALYLVTFIIAFGRVPDWFRILIGNLAPVMILLLVFIMSAVAVGLNISMEIGLLLHILTFFATALMCHYELARDRPSPQFLTEFFLLMSVGGVLGGIFNSLLAPLLFPHAFEYPIVLIMACFMVPKLIGDEEKDEAKIPRDEPLATKEYLAFFVAGAVLSVVLLGAILLALALVAIVLLLVSLNRLPRVHLDRLKTWLGSRIKRQQLDAALDGAFPVAVGLLFVFLRGLPGDEWYSENSYGGSKWFLSILKTLMETFSMGASTILSILLFAVPVMLCFFFVDRPLRFGLCVAALLGYSRYCIEYKDSSSVLIHSERSFFGILKVEQYEVEQRAFRATDGTLVPSGKIIFHKLVHGTTLHGTQIYKMDNNVLDSFQFLTALNSWDNLVVAGANHAFNIREEPLTYYHRSGPVGAMFHELRTRKGGADAKAHFAMVGLGTGSASCYALPGQKITFYEIDPAVKHLVADIDTYFTFVTDARKRGAELDIQMGDARLKLKENVDRKYALLLVDAFSSDSIPVHLLTTQAVQLYLDRMTDDGILALHISNRWIRLEPVVAAIARDLGLTARVWNDDSEKRPGKTASSWVVLARKPEHLGHLYSPIGDLLYGPPEPGKNHRMWTSMEAQLVRGVYNDHDDELARGKPKDKYQELNTAEDPKAAWLAWIDQKLPQVSDVVLKARLGLFRDLIQKYGQSSTFSEVMHAEHGHGFRPLEFYVEVDAWTDDYSDVMRVMNLPGLQRVRRFFGLPTPIGLPSRE